MKARLPQFLLLGGLVCGAAGLHSPRPASATPVPNVLWGFKDSVAACPAGDSLVGLPGAPHPSKLRIPVFYFDNAGNPRVGVPPESIFVTISNAAGNVVANDMANHIFADDSTNSLGMARVTISSFSGSGLLNVFMYVSGVSQGIQTATIRTVDNNADGRVGVSDTTSYADINYDGATNSSDGHMAALHLYHWHRNALFGTLRKLTTFCDACVAEAPNTPGEGLTTWSPDGSQLTYSAHFNRAADGLYPCQIYITSTTPSSGVHGRPFTASGSRDSLAQAAASDSSDYDPQWSPLGNEIVWDRADVVIYRKSIAGAPGIVDTLEHGVYQAQPGQLNVTDIGGLSPDGQEVAFCVFPSNVQASDIYTIKLDGTGLHQVTSPSNLVFDEYPAWSSDGRMLTFIREALAGQTRTHTLETIAATAGPSTAPTPITAFSNTGGIGNPAPAFAPDNAVVAVSLPVTSGASNLGVNTLDVTGGAGATPPAVQGYGRFVSPRLMSPRLSPDGTRLAMTALNPDSASATTPQIWAAEQNMSLPPSITAAGGVSVDGEAPFADVVIGRDSTLTLTTTRADPEGDAIADSAYFLQQGLGMSWSASTHTLTWNVLGVPVGVYTVRLQSTTPSGGTAYALARIHVRDNVPPIATPSISAQCDPSSGNTWDLSWVAPADDSNLTASGPATAYDIRVSGAPITLANWASATPIGGPTPGSPGATDTWAVTVTGTTYLRIRAEDAVGNWSGLGAQVVLHTYLDCGGHSGAFIGGSGGGAGGAAEEISVLQDAVRDVYSADIVAAPQIVAKAGTYPMSFRLARGNALSLDRFSLLAVDHPSGERAFLLRDWPIVGAAVPSQHANDGSGMDVTTLVQGKDATGFTGSTGTLVTVRLAADTVRARDPIVIEGSGLGADSSSVVVEAPDSVLGWRAIQEIALRSNYADATVDSVASDSVRLIYHGPAAVRFVGRVARSSERPLISWAAICSANDPTAGNVLGPTQAADTAAVTLVGPDTLSLGFTVPALQAGLVRDCFFSLNATPLNPRTATRTLASSTSGSGAQHFSFRLFQNQPNPLVQSASIRFEIPTPGHARVELYDLLGRRVRVLADENFAGGQHGLSWNATDSRGRPLAGGVYLCRLSFGGRSATERIVVLGQ